MTFKEKLVILRKSKGLTQDEFASAVGVSRQAVYKWECGQSYPEVPKLLEMKLLFTISIDELLDDSYDIPVPEKKKRKRISKDAQNKIKESVEKEIKIPTPKTAPKAAPAPKAVPAPAPAPVATPAPVALAPKVEAAPEVSYVPELKTAAISITKPAVEAAPAPAPVAEAPVAPAPVAEPAPAPVVEEPAEPAAEESAKKGGFFGNLFRRR